MATTTNLSLNQPAYNSSAWDVPLNNNETILDNQFAATTSISLTNSNVTLTSPNTTGTGQTQAMRIVLTGSLSANVQVIIPSGISGQWIIYNTTTGSYSVTIASNGGGTSVVAPQNYNIIVYSDGTNIKKADDGLLNIFPISVSNGGTGLATLTANNVILGNGSSSPSFVAPGTIGNILTSDGTTWVSQTPSAPATLPAGIITPYAGSSAPTGWLLCSGGQVSRTTYATLFSAIGTTFGSGDGSTTFNLPDLRGRAVFGVDNMGGSSANRVTTAGSGIDGVTLGASGGAENITLTTNQIPSHSHNFGNFTVLYGVSGGQGNYGASISTSNGNNSNPGYATAVQSTGGDQSHNNMSPTLIMNYIIKT